MQLVVKSISENELEHFLAVLKETAIWLRSEGKEMWNEQQLSSVNLLKNNVMDELFIGCKNDEVAAVMILQDEDKLFWPSAKNDSLFLHKLAVRRKYAKQGVSKDMIDWAKSRARYLNKKYLRLDCDAERHKLCDFYEGQSFKKVSERIMFGKYLTAFYEFEIHY